jgi:hypothetical protein
MAHAGERISGCEVMKVKVKGNMRSCNDVATHEKMTETDNLTYYDNVNRNARIFSVFLAVVSRQKGGCEGLT